MLSGENNNRINIPIGVWVLAVLVFAEVVVLNVAWQYATGKLQVGGSWSGPVSEDLPILFVWTFGEEVLFRLFPIVLVLWLARGRTGLMFMVAVATSVAYGFLVHSGLHKQILLTILGGLLFAVCYLQIKTRGWLHAPSALATVVVIHFLYNLQLRVLIAVF